MTDHRFHLERQIRHALECALDPDTCVQVIVIISRTVLMAIRLVPQCPANIALDTAQERCGNPVDPRQVHVGNRLARGGQHIGGRLLRRMLPPPDQASAHCVQSWPERQQQKCLRTAFCLLFRLRGCDQCAKDVVLALWRIVATVQAFQNCRRIGEVLQRLMIASEGFQAALKAKCRR